MARSIHEFLLRDDAIQHSKTKDHSSAPRIPVSANAALPRWYLQIRKPHEPSPQPAIFFDFGKSLPLRKPCQH